MQLFLSYRANEIESASVAGRLQDRLAAEFGGIGNVFMDVGSLTAGADFSVEIREWIERCDYFLVLIGPRWEEILESRAASAETDYARLELAIALDRGIRIVPILVEREGLPDESRLPGPLKKLRRFHASRVNVRPFDPGPLISDLKKSGPIELSGLTSVQLVGTDQYARRFSLVCDDVVHLLEWRQRVATTDELLLDGKVVDTMDVVDEFFSGFGYRRHYSHTIRPGLEIDVEVRKLAFFRGLDGFEVRCNGEVYYSEGTVH